MTTFHIFMILFLPCQQRGRRLAISFVCPSAQATICSEHDTSTKLVSFMKLGEDIHDFMFFYVKCYCWRGFRILYCFLLCSKFNQEICFLYQCYSTIPIHVQPFNLKPKGSQYIRLYHKLTNKLIIYSYCQTCKSSCKRIFIQSSKRIPADGP